MDEAYDKIAQLLNQEIRKRGGSTQELERFRETLDVAFYLLGWGQFEIPGSKGGRRAY